MTTAGKPPSRIPIARPSLGGREAEYLQQCVESSWISSQGPFIDEFERRFAAFAGTEYAIATSNGTTALHLALAGLGIGPGDEVIVPSLTFVATANVVRYCGATPVFVDSEMETWNMDPQAVEDAVTPRTRAIIPVHLYGQPCKMDEIRSVAAARSIRVIEDAAEAHGAAYRGQPVGSLGDAGCFSFYGNKIVTTGEGGMLVTDSRALYEQARVLRDHGMDPARKYWHTRIGFNYRMTNMQAAIGVAQMERIDAILGRRREIARRYRQRLSAVDGLILSPANDWSSGVCWMFCIVLSSGSLDGRDRDSLMERLADGGIETRPFFRPAHRMPMYDTGQSLDRCEFLSANGINLPAFTDLADDEIDRVCSAIASARR